MTIAPAMFAGAARDAAMYAVKHQQRRDALSTEDLHLDEGGARVRLEEWEPYHALNGSMCEIYDEFIRGAWGGLGGDVGDEQRVDDGGMEAAEALFRESEEAAKRLTLNPKP